VVRADLSPLSNSAEAKQGPNGKVYYTVIFSIEIHFGLTEFKARLKWVDNVNTSALLFKRLLIVESFRAILNSEHRHPNTNIGTVTNIACS
jgi:hypothetical protein